MPQLSLLGPVAAGPFLIPRIAVRDISVLWCCRTSSHNLIRSNLHKLILRPILSTQAVAAAEYTGNNTSGKENDMDIEIGAHNIASVLLAKYIQDENVNVSNVKNDQIKVSATEMSNIYNQYYDMALSQLAKEKAASN